MNHQSITVQQGLTSTNQINEPYDRRAGLQRSLFPLSAIDSHFSWCPTHSGLDQSVFCEEVLSDPNHCGSDTRAELSHDRKSSCLFRKGGTQQLNMWLRATSVITSHCGCMWCNCFLVAKRKSLRQVKKFVNFPSKLCASFRDNEK